MKTLVKISNSTAIVLGASWGNALRRPCDRIESAVAITLAALFLIAGPAAAIAAGRLADSSVLRQARAEQAWHQVTATVVRGSAHRLEASPSGWLVLSVRATWTAGGRTRTAWVAFSRGPGNHKTVGVWVYSDGRLAAPPSARANVDSEVTLAAVSAILGLAVMLAGVGLGTRCLLDWRRMTIWENAWRTIGPEWRRQL